MGKQNKYLDKIECMTSERRVEKTMTKCVTTSRGERARGDGAHMHHCKLNLQRPHQDVPDRGSRPATTAPTNRHDDGTISPVGRVRGR